MSSSTTGSTRRLAGPPRRTSPGRAGADLAGLARAAGIEAVHVAMTVAEFADQFRAALEDPRPVFIHARIEPGRAKLPPIAVDEVENKYRLIRYIERTEGISILTRPQPASQVTKP